MKRDPRLHDLSRDHHHALVLARRASQALESADEDISAMWAEIAEAFANDLQPHFEVEEQYLLVALDRAGAADLSQRTRADLSAHQLAEVARASAATEAASRRRNDD